MAGWDYEEHDGGKENRPHGRVAARCVRVLRQLRTGLLPNFGVLQDTRPVHAFLFRGLTPPGEPAFAGNYRGAPFHYLRDYNVVIGNSHGVAAPYVEQTMTQFASLVQANVQRIEQKLAQDNVPDDEAVLIATTFATEALVTFLQIHPYANGNGHISRFIVWSFLGTFGIWPKSWPFEARPPHPFDQHIGLYIRGIRDPLVQTILEAVITPPPISARIKPWRSVKYIWMRAKAMFASLFVDRRPGAD